MTPSPNEVERLADAATREIHGDDYRIATRLVIERAIREALREAGNLRSDGETITERYMQFASLHDDKEEYLIAKDYNERFKRQAIAKERR